MKKEIQEAKLHDWLHRHKGLLLKVVRSFANSHHDQDDLFQEIVLQVWKSIPKYNGSVCESTWIYRVSFYTAISWTRKQQHRKNIGIELSDLSNVWVSPREQNDPKLDWLYAQIQTLDPIDRSLTLMLLDGFTYREMSQTLGITESNVGVRINRIKTRLIHRSKQGAWNEF